jgi:putative transposase
MTRDQVINDEKLGTYRYKVEEIHGERVLNQADAKQQVFDYIDVYYNRKQLHSILDHIIPEAFELKKLRLVKFL